MLSANGDRSGFYFIGIGGVSMSALALYLHGHGAAVRGSDAKESGFTRRLRGEGIPVSIGEDEEITEDTVVVTGAVGETAQLAQARARNKTILSRAEFLGAVAARFPHVLSVAGCHGKTTCTAMLSHIFYGCGAPFTCHIGGEDLDLTNYFSAGDRYFITEACEFKRSFLALHSEAGIILNIGLDHTDCYSSEEEIAEAYAAFGRNCRSLIVNGDDALARALPHRLSFGLCEGDIRAEELRSDNERYSFTVTEGGIPLERIKLKAVGRVNVMNALAAFSAARLMGFSAREIKRGLESFRGVRRRFETVGTFCGTPVVCDYAHHPQEIAATLSAAKRMTAGRVIVVFQPHTYTRTRDLMEEFEEALGRTEQLILYRTFAAREPFLPEGSAVALAARLPRAVYEQTPERLARRLTDTHPGPDDLILVLGAGDIYETVLRLLD